MTIELTPDVEAALAAEARRRGTSAELLALDVLRERFVRPSGGNEQTRPATTLAEYLRPHIGVLSSGEQVPGGANMSQNSGAKFAEAMVEKRKQGRL